MPARSRGRITVTMLLTMGFLVACAGPAKKADPLPLPEPGGKAAPTAPGQGKGADQGGGPGAEQTEVTVYFANSAADKLVPVKRAVAPGESTINAALQALINGPNQSEQVGAVMPQGTKLLAVNVNQGVAHVNLSREFRANHPGGSAGEILTLYAIANTLTQFPQVKTVRLYVEGTVLNEFIHMDLGQGLQRREDLIAAP